MPLRMEEELLDNKSIISQRIIADLSEGVLAIGLDGVIIEANPEARKLLNKDDSEFVGKKFASVFFEYEQNDDFNQLILDAIYDMEKSHTGIVEFFDGEKKKHFNVKTSFLKNESKKVGVIVVLGDVTELVELRDALLAMKKIQALNTKLELRNKLLSETFGRFLSDEIVHQLLETKDGLKLGGKKQSITVLMSDLRGFTALSEQMEPADLLAMLNHYLEQMTEIIQACNGTIIEFIGDGIMCIFGAPSYFEDHPMNAVRAAVYMQKKMGEINAWNKLRGYPKLEMGIGVNTGEMIVGNIGSDKRTKYGVVGKEVNIAGRVESYTVGGQILVAESTKLACKDKLIVNESREIYPKGAASAMNIYEIVGILDEVSIDKPLIDRERKKLDVPIELEANLVSGKHVLKEKFTLKMLSLSSKSAEIYTEKKLEKYDNVQILFEGDEKLFAKVTDSNEMIELFFTSKLPESLQRVLQE